MFGSQLPFEHSRVGFRVLAAALRVHERIGLTGGPSSELSCDVGEIRVHGPQMVSSYRNRPEETA